MTLLPKLVVLLGPTASGKTSLGIQLAKHFNGEIVSADSRQVYKKMTIGTAKPMGNWTTVEGKKKYVVDGVPHYMMDIIDPGTDMSLADFKKAAMEHIDDIIKRGKVPFLVGGTGLYIWSIVDNLSMPRVAPQKKLRRSLESKTLVELAAWLKRIDPASARIVDLNNPRRVIRALEVAILTGESFVKQQTKGNPLYSSLQIGIKLPQEELDARIKRRIETQISAGWINETEQLVKQRYGWNLSSMSSLGYREIGMYLRGQCSLAEAEEKMYRATRQYAKRQMTWFKRDKRVVWINGPDEKQAGELLAEFINEKQNPIID